MSFSKIAKKSTLFLTGSMLCLALAGLTPNSNKPTQQAHKAVQQYNLQKSCEATQQFRDDQVKQEKLMYDLKCYFLGIKAIDEPVTWSITTKENNQSLEGILNLIMPPASTILGDCKGVLNARKVIIKDPSSKDEPYEEYAYNISAKDTSYKKHITFYSDRAELKNGDTLIKQGAYTGVFSLLQQVTQEDLKVGDVYRTKTVFGDSEYKVELMVEDAGKGEKMSQKYQKNFRPKEDFITPDNYVEEHEKYMDYETYRIRVKTERLGKKEQVKDKIYAWIGKEGKNKGKIIQLEVYYNWAVSVKLILAE